MDMILETYQLTEKTIHHIFLISDLLDDVEESSVIDLEDSWFTRFSEAFERWQKIAAELEQMFYTSGILFSSQYQKTLNVQGQNTTSYHDLVLTLSIGYYDEMRKWIGSRLETDQDIILEKIKDQCLEWRKQQDKYLNFLEQAGDPYLYAKEHGDEQYLPSDLTIPSFQPYKKNYLLSRIKKEYYQVLTKAVENGRVSSTRELYRLLIGESPSSLLQHASNNENSSMTSENSKTSLDGPVMTHKERREQLNETVNNQMQQIMLNNDPCLKWSAQDWADVLDCAKSTVVDTEAWGQIQIVIESKRSKFHEKHQTNFNGRSARSVDTVGSRSTTD